MPQTKQPAASPMGLWFAEHGRTLLWFVGGGAVVVLGVLYILSLLDEQVAGALLATLIIGIACAQAAGAMSEAAPNRGLAILALVFGIATFGAAMASAIPSLVPGEPAVRAALGKEGDSMELPSSTHGPIRVLVHGKLAGSEAGTASVDLDLGQQHLTAELNRTFSRARVGRRGSTTVVHEHDDEYLEANAGPDASRITLSTIHGALGGPVEVSVFSDPLPMRWEIALGAILLVLGSWLSASWGARSAGVTALTSALLFGILVRRMATPHAAVGPEFGALMISLFAAVFISTIVLTVLQRLVASRRTA
jgi:hypothetical protein